MATMATLRLLRLHPNASSTCRLFSSEAATAQVQEGKGMSVADFLKGIGQGVEVHADKVAAEVHSIEHLVLVKRTKLKKIGVPCKLRRLIMRYTEKYRQNRWKPKVEESS